MNEPLSARRVKQLFGRKSQVTKHTLPTIYDALAEDPALKLAKPPKSSVDWKRYGQQYDIENGSPGILLGALHVYYAGIALWLAAERIAQQNDQPYWQEVVSGRFFQKNGIQNLVAPDWMQEALMAIDTAHFPQFDVPGMPGDVLKHLYQDLIPKKIRHAVGAYYTPDWLADHLLAQVDYDGPQPAALHRRPQAAGPSAPASAQWKRSRIPAARPPVAAAAARFPSRQALPA